MTVIAAMRDTDGSILMGSDSKAIEDTGISYTLDKLKVHPSGSLVWGTAGPLSLGIRFSEWLTAYDLSHTRWQELQEEITEKVCELNGNERRSVKDCESTPDAGDAILVLVAGRIDGVTRLFSINDRGNCVVIEPPWDFEAIGARAQAKYILLGIDYMLAYLAKGGVDVSLFNKLVKMQLLLEAINARVEGCGPPPHIWRIGQNGVEKLLP